MARELRRPCDGTVFDRLALSATERRLNGPWWSLRWLEHANASNPFFASQSGRLTPASGKVPCLYLARSRETSFLEIYGDDIAAATKRRSWTRFSRNQMERRIFCRLLRDVTVRIYDLSAKGSARAIGLDLATLYSAEVEFPRQFAQRIHDHPAKFDGIQYISRHTQQHCIVLWGTYHRHPEAFSIVQVRSLWAEAKFDRRLPAGKVRVFNSVAEVAAPRGGEKDP